MLNSFPDTQESLLLIHAIIPVAEQFHRIDCWITWPLLALDFPPALREEQLLGQLCLRVALGILGGSTLWVLSLVCVFISGERTAGSHDFSRN